jgi:hypothetical protein
VVGRSIDVIIPAEFRERHHHGLGRAMSGGERHLEGAATHLPVLLADGTVVVHPARFNHITTAENKLIAATAVFGPAKPDQAAWTPITSPAANTPPG